MRRLFLLPVLLLAVSLPAVAAPPAVGQTAPDFTLPTLSGSAITLSSLARSGGPVVLVVLRGYPGYLCPFSQQIFNSYQQYAAQFAALGAQMLVVFPGAANKNLASDAASLLGSVALPSNVHLVLDPDYSFTNLYGLRWNATDETVYPSTFLINPNRQVVFSHVGQFHSDFTPVSDALLVVNADNNNPK